MTISALGIDLAKNTYQLHRVDGAGKAALKKRLSRNELATYIAGLTACRIVMEACGGANYWARVFQRSGHQVKLINSCPSNHHKQTNLAGYCANYRYITSYWTSNGKHKSI
ncbi:MAG: transposase [Flavobacterium sp.]|jgi:transposase